MSNAEIVAALKQMVDDAGIRYVHLAKKTEIDYQRLIRIFTQGADMKGTELLRICSELNHDPKCFYANRAS